MINKNLLLLVNIRSYQDKVTKEINCTFIEIIKNNCTLNCFTTDINKYDLQSSISIFEDSILMINFDCLNKENYSIFSPEKERQKQKQNDIVRYNLNKSKKFGTRANLAIILACAVLLAIIIGLIYYFQKKML